MLSIGSFLKPSLTNEGYMPLQLSWWSVGHQLLGCTRLL